MKRLLIITISLFSALNCNENYLYKTEAKGIWVPRFAYTTNVDTLDAEAQIDTVRTIIRTAAEHKFNFVLFQVRGNGTVFYRSEHEPWAKELTGILGKDPGWDPLAFAVEEAHNKGLELHAWVNTFPAWRGDTLPEMCDPPQIVTVHPEWIVCDSTGTPMEPNPGYINLSPGIPEAREHIINTVMETVSNYDIDGIHFDYIRYPEGASFKGFSMDPVSLSRFNSAEGNPERHDWEEWQREQITQFLRDFSERAKAVKSYVKISCAVIGKYKGEGWTAFNQVYQSPKKWLSEGLVDFICPMIYWRRDREGYEFGKLLAEWVYDNQNMVFPGIALYRADSPGWKPDEIKAEIEISRGVRTKGFVFFSSESIEEYKKPVYSSFKLNSNFPSINSQFPVEPVKNIQTACSDSSIIINWDYPGNALFYNIYRSEQFNLNANLNKNLYKKIFSVYRKFEDKSAEKGKFYFYKVSAVDRYGNESEPSNIIQVKF
jgi:uncharacterized lipoprotein YddW (UPF0748 family)